MCKYAALNYIDISDKITQPQITSYEDFDVDNFRFEDRGPSPTNPSYPG